GFVQPRWLRRNMPILPCISLKIGPQQSVNDTSPMKRGLKLVVDPRMRGFRERERHIPNEEGTETIQETIKRIKCILNDTYPMKRGLKHVCLLPTVLPRWPGTTHPQ